MARRVVSESAARGLHSTLSKRPGVSLDALDVPRRQHSFAAIRIGLGLLDTLFVSLFILAGMWSAYSGSNGREVVAPLAAGIVGASMFLLMLRTTHAYRFERSETVTAHLRKVATACAAALGIWLTAALLLRPNSFSSDALAGAGLMASVIIIVLHTAYWTWMHGLHSRGALAPTIVMLGATPSARRLIEHNARTRELNIVAIFDERTQSAPHNIHGVPVVGTPTDLLEWDRLPYIDRIVISLPRSAAGRVRDFIGKVSHMPNRIAIIDDGFADLDYLALRSRQIANLSLREVTGEPKPAWHTAAKRLVDIVVGGIALIALLPAMLVIGLLIRLDSPGPALFRQVREGFNGRSFEVLKFRSLRQEHGDAQAASQVVSGDSRVTRLGRFIRKTSIDELPQLWNVLCGDMSLVGPRPHTPGMKTGEVESRRLVTEYAHRHKVKPGMTGWAQICGSRGPLHDADEVARRVALDIEYIEDASIWWDFAIMAKTLPCLLGDRNNVR